MIHQELRRPSPFDTSVCYLNVFTSEFSGGPILAAHLIDLYLNSGINRPLFAHVSDEHPIQTSQTLCQ